MRYFDLAQKLSAGRKKFMTLVEQPTFTKRKLDYMNFIPPICSHHRRVRNTARCRMRIQTGRRQSRRSRHVIAAALTMSASGDTSCSSATSSLTWVGMLTWSSPGVVNYLISKTSTRESSCAEPPELFGTSAWMAWSIPRPAIRAGSARFCRQARSCSLTRWSFDAIILLPT